ncbi:conserved hypothetical protein [Ixodes scapularis]|uniref:Uncharacterized protein n=1 Tax=Ixodes scapularis TaxID=6945 RepID=B7PSN3_IXOSC|nr:conserved hypothetical protein [Ixodes scapularis]|eukprot:XP_002402767.1 conserved hypothetical protein [Ixodes scapularis]
MGRVIRAQRKGAGSVFRSHNKHRKGAPNCVPWTMLSDTGTSRDRQGDHPRPGQGCPTGQGGVPGPLPLQAQEGAVPGRRGHAHGTVCLLRQEGHSRGGQRVARGHDARGHGDLQRGGEGRGPGPPGPHLGQLRHGDCPQPGHAQDARQAALRRQEGAALGQPGHGGHHRGRRPGREAHPQGRARLPQVQGQAQLMAQGPRCRHEPCGAPPRWWQPPAHWQGLDRQEGCIRRSQGGSDCCQAHRSHQGRQDQHPGQGRLSSTVIKGEEELGCPVCFSIFI